MTYYEELGLPPTASADQIRHSYKTLVRLLHPDQCHDDNVKRLAELQMRRLNQLHAVLADPEQRRRYDAHLQGPVMPTRQRTDHLEIPIPQNRQWLRRLLIGLCAWGTPAAAFVACMAVLWYYGSGVLPAITSSTPAADERYASSSTPVAASANAETAGVRDIEGTEPVADSSLLALSAAGFAGHWYYVTAARPIPSKGTPIPETIDLQVSESAGLVSGRYQAHYRALDEPADPDVLFQFEGVGGIPAAQLPWTGPGKSKGKVTLRLISADQIEVTWFATQLSPELNLSSGSAHLVRQREPSN